MQKTVRRLENLAPVIPMRKRVAAYARVSDGKDAMLHSLSAQISYYSELIQKMPGWEYAGVYIDKALTGTRDTRQEFNRMIEDSKAGKIDMIITKAISRFARNTVTVLETVRELKNIGVDVYFEKEKIHSMSGDGELMLSILSSFAQEESLSVSENCKWRIRDKFKRGIPTVHPILGYRYVNENLEIVPEEAKIVQMIFKLYLEGMGTNAIMKHLRRLKVPTKMGGQWQESSVMKILKNEKYTGNLLLQKKYVKDHLTKKLCINRGELPQYYVENNHEAIIDIETFEKVQQKIKGQPNSSKKSKSQNTYPFTSKIICGQCGKHYRRKIANASTKYAHPVWICATYNRLGKKFCSSKQIPEDILLKLVPPDFKEIIVPEQNKIAIILNDGSKIEKTWCYKSRSESWTKKMREAARERRVKNGVSS